MGYIKKFIAVVLTILMAILTLAFGCMLLPSLTGCASTGGGVDIETGVDTKVDTTPWLTPRPITIYEFNQTPDTIRHGFVLSGEEDSSARVSDRHMATPGGHITGNVDQSAAHVYGIGAGRAICGLDTSQSSHIFDAPGYPFLWAYVSRQGVAVYSPMTGADIPTTPCVILSRRTR